MDTDTSETQRDQQQSSQQLHTSDLLTDDRATSGTDSAVDLTEESGGQNVALLDDAPAFEDRWHDIQVRFVDEPRKAVEDADALVAEVMRRLAETYAAERNRMEDQWQAGGQVSTEDLRVALQRYRSFFQRLLAA